MLGKMFSQSRDLFLVIGTIIILLILFSPIPPMALDLSIIINFGLGLTILLLTFYVAKPVEFSTFPSLLLVATLYRLALNVAATRLILTGADAGDVIGSIGSYAVQGNFIIGLVVFFILVVVQYVVVTSGAQRVSEVAARFTLDSMPGQQMSIDADLNMGLIDQNEAVERRKELEKEASFYGAMDGASKFVKGDAIAGIIILLIDIIAGWIVGVVQMNMSWIDALQHFTLLTIGDGIATQLPALIISVATGIIVTRSASDRELSTEVLKQLTSVPKIPLIVVVALTLLLLLPGMPKWPILLIVFVLGIAFLQLRRKAKAVETVGDTQDFSENEPVETDAPLPVGIHLGSVLHAAWQNQEAALFERISALRNSFKQRLGFAFPHVKLVQKDTLGANGYAVSVYDVEHGKSEIYPDKTLAVRSEVAKDPLPGIKAKDPAFGIEAYWIDDHLLQSSTDYTLVDPMTVLLTHVNEILNDEAEALLSRSVVVQMLDGLRSRQPGLVEDLIPNIMSVADIQRVMRNLLAENVSIANIDIIAETLVDIGRTVKDPVDLTEHVRQRLKHVICQGLRGDNDDLSVLSLDPRIEHRILKEISANGGHAATVVEPKLAEQLIRGLSPLADTMLRKGCNPVLLCGPELRRHLRSLTRRSIPKLAILSVNEIPAKINLKSFDVLKFET